MMPLKMAAVNPASASLDSSASQPAEADGHTPRRPGLLQFDSLQQLLEDAGYRETRIITPLHPKTPASPPTISHTQAASSSKVPMTVTIPVEDGPRSHTGPGSCSSSTVETPDQDDAQHIDHLKAIAAGTSWFNAPWNTLLGKGQQNTSSSSLRKKRSEPILSKKPSVGSWASSWWRTRNTPNAEPSRIEKHGTQQPASASPQRTIRPALRHAPSTQHLWQASLRHHRSKAQGAMIRSRSFPSRLRRVDEPVVLTRKQSYDGARLVTGVGVRAAERALIAGGNVFVRKHERRISLRQAFEEDAEDVRELATPKGNDGASRSDWRDSISSLADVQESRRHANSMPPQQVDASAVAGITPTPPATEESPGLQLFSTVAAPIVSRDDAVAMRNSACLQFDNSIGFASPPSSNVSGRLRKMRSVDALELALARMQAKKEINSSSIQATIPESSSADSLTAEDFANARTTQMPSDRQEIESSLNAAQHELMQRCPTPTLVITSPTGIRPPQPLVLDGVEFEPHSVSPKGPMSSLARPVPKRNGWKIIVRKDPKSQESAVLDSTVQRRGRPEGSKALIDIDGERLRSGKRAGLSKPKVRRPESNGENLQTPSLRKRSSTKSCGNLGQAANRAVRAEALILRSATGKLTGSEQIRALHRSVQQRDRSVLSGSAAQCVPRTPTEEDEDDPFNDFVALTQAGAGSVQKRGLRKTVDGGTIIDRSNMSPVPFERSSNRSPLGENGSLMNAPSASEDVKDPGAKEAKPGRTYADERTKALVKKRSGVGLACLVDLDQQSAERLKRVQLKTRTSSLSDHSRRQLGPQLNAANRKTSHSPKSLLDDASKTTSGAAMHVNDENVNLLDSPTARAGHRVLKRRSSRVRN